MQQRHPAKAAFYAALVAAARKRGVRQRELAAQLQIDPSILSRRIKGQGPLDSEARVLQAIRALGLEASQASLRQLWREAHSAIYECESHAPAAAAPEDNDALRREYRELLVQAESGKRLARLVTVCLELSTSCHALGHWQRALAYARQAFEVAQCGDDCRLQLVSRHELALVTRLSELGSADAAVSQFSELIRVYREALPQRLVGEDALARAYRDGARAVAREPEGWEVAQRLLGESHRWAADAGVPDRGQSFHTRLDRCALAVLRSDRESAERELAAADRLRGAAARQRETWLNLRTDAKHGLVGATVSGLAGDRDGCVAAAIYWVEHWEEAAGIQSLETATSVLAWAHSNFEKPLAPAVLLR